MTKIKFFCYSVVLAIAILLTFGLTRYTGQKCVQKKDSTKQNSPTINSSAHRLSTNLIPLNYDLVVQPFMRPDQYSFDGSVRILVNCKESTNVIELHADLEIFRQNITVQQATVDGFNETKQFELSSFTIKNQVLTIKLTENLRKNENYTIFIPFKGKLTKSLVGFYRSDYLNVQLNRTDDFVITQFEPVDARRAFPCFDEPSFKATFDIEIRHLSNMTAISNMPALSTEVIDSEWSRTKFDRTVKMSTYLVAYAVGDFEFQESNSSKTKVRIVTRPNVKELTKLALEVAPKILTHFEDYFQIDFPLPKIDLLATPDFANGAMENWGLITYRESTLLYDERFDTARELYTIISDTAHELAHQWSGNLVTMKWWDGIWLNEGFATYMAYEGVNATRPELKVWDLLVLDEIHGSLTLDSLESSHPISVKVNNPSEINQLFDHISYAKSASIINMMTYIIGKTAFKQGLHNYLNEFKYSNAVQDDLWKHLQAASDQNQLGNNSIKLNVKKIMDSWTLKEGYPLITVTRNSTKVRFAQRRFLQNCEDKEKLIRDQYVVPITFTSKSEQNWEPETRFLLDKKEGESYSDIELKIEEDEWIIANLQQTGYYRVTYDEKNWELLVRQLRLDPNKIHRINRAQILDDLFNLAENGIVKYKLALKAIKYLVQEKDPLAWISIGRLIRHINSMLRRTNSFGHWQNFIRNLIENAYNSVDLKIVEKDLQESLKKLSVINVACSYNLKKCVDDSKELFYEFRTSANEISIPSDMRLQVYCTAIHHGDELEWNFMYERYLKEQNGNERNRIVSALACTRVPWLLTSYLERIFNESSGFKRQDILRAFKGIATNNYGKDIAYKFLRENWQSIYRVYENDKKQFAIIIKSFDSMNTEFELKEFQEFHRSIGPKVQSDRAFLQTIDKIKSNIVWMKRYKSEINQFLADEH